MSPYYSRMTRRSLAANRKKNRAPHTLSERMRYSAERWNSGGAAGIIALGWADEVEALEAEIERLKPAPITPVDKLNQGYERAGLSSALVVNNKYGKRSAFGYMGRE